MAKQQERTNYNYQYDSTARAYVPSVEPLKVPTPVSPKRQPGVRTKRKVDVAFGIQISMCVVVLFVSSFLYIDGYASLRAKQRELNALKNDKIAIVNEMTKINAEMSKKIDLEYIRQRAINELGMRKPLAHQIVYIQLPEKSYTSYQ